MNILIINQPLNNRGDESAHKALIRGLLSSFPNVRINVLFVDCNAVDGIRQFSVISSQVEYINIHSVRGYYKFGQMPIKNGNFFLWNLHPTTNVIKSYYKEADIVVCAPGGICMGGFQDWNHLMFLRWAKFCKKPLVYYGRSFGPFPTYTDLNKRFKAISLEMLNYFSFLSIRDRKTEVLADEIGIHNYVSTVDTAFLDNPSVDLPYEIKQQLADRQYIVFVPNFLLWHYHFKGKATKEQVILFFCEIAKEIISCYPDYNIVMLPQTFGNTSYEISDVLFFRDIAEQVDDNRIKVLPDCYSSDVQQSIISKSKFVIGARYHSIVFSINQNVPFLALSYEHKISGLLLSLGIEDSMVDISSAFDSSMQMLGILQAIKGELKQISYHPSAQGDAKAKAQFSFDRLIDFLASFKKSSEND